MSTAVQLLAAIIANPDEDTPRLAYADFIQENDQPERAEFIRVQCEYAALPEWDLRAKHLRHRIRVLLARHGRDWFAELGTLKGVTWGSFQRGFVNAIGVDSAETLRRAAGAILAAAPVERVEFLGEEITDGEPLRFPWVRAIKLTDRTEFAADQFEALLNSGIAENLRVLDLGGVGVENAGAAVIARATHLTQLEEIDFSNCFVGVRGVESLAGAKHLVSLRKLNFSRFGSGYVEDPFVTDAGVEVLAAAGSPFVNLTKLRLGGNQLGDAAVRALLASTSLTKLEKVEFRYCELSPAAFAPSTGSARWKSLDVAGVRFPADAFRAMVALPQLSQLAQLRANRADLDADDMQALAEASCVSELRELYLSDNGFASAGAQSLAGGNWTNLHTLDLRDDKIGPSGVVALTAGTFPVMTDLCLDANEVGTIGAKAIADAPWAGSLRRLRLKGTKLDSDDVKSLAASPGLRNLTELSLESNAPGIEGVKAIAAADMPELTDLNLNDTLVQNESLKALTAASFFGNLLELGLMKARITAEGVRALVEANPPWLRQLTLSENLKLGAASLVELAKPGRFPSLVVLLLTNCGLDAKSLETFADSDLVTRLRRFQCHGNPTSQELHRRLGAKQWGALGPDWIQEDTIKDGEEE